VLPLYARDLSQVKYGYGGSTTVLTQTSPPVTPSLPFLCCRNPYRKLTAKKQALFEVHPPFSITVVEDTSQSHAFNALGHDLYQIRYTLQIQAGAAAPAPKAPSDSVGSSLGSAVAEPPLASDTSKTAKSATKYHDDWITKLKLARRSILVTLINDTDRDFERGGWFVEYLLDIVYITELNDLIGIYFVAYGDLSQRR